LPEFKIHCSALGAAGFRVAVMDYNQGIGETLIPIGNLRLLDDLP
jgi:hypothetical protein